MPPIVSFNTHCLVKWSMAKLFVLIGLPGSGKSKIAQRLHCDNAALYLSSDALRKEFYGDESVQDNPEKIFEEMRKRAVAALKVGINVVYDATNISRKKRRHLLSSLGVPCEKIAYVVWARYETCVMRDKDRLRTVGEGVIKRMLKSFQPPYYDEGWDEIRFVLNDDPYTADDYMDWVNCEHDNPHHNNTVKEHSLKVAAEVNNLNGDYDIVLLFAALLHDVGKKFVKDFKDSRGNPSEIAHFYNHQNVGSYFAIGHESTLELSVQQRALLYWLINVHMDLFLHTKYCATLPEELSKLLNDFHHCDVKGA